MPNRNKYVHCDECNLLIRKDRMKSHMKNMTEIIFSEKFKKRFWSAVSTVETEDGCLEWKLSCNADGYGKVDFEGKMNGAHRIAFQLFNKRLIAEGLHILHKCDNRKCCNPIHLSEGTHQENMDDMISKNRQAKGETNGLSKLTETQVREIRKKYQEGTFTYTQLATEYSICRQNISRIIRRIIWTHI